MAILPIAVMRSIHVRKPPFFELVAVYDRAMNHTDLSTEICDRARLARDARFDGLFYTAVRSTKIYCRPVCPAPTPKAANIEYFQYAAAAQAAGFRPCLRCRPELSPQAMRFWSGDRLLDQALIWLGESSNAGHANSMSELATRLGISARHLQRLFVQRIGVGPKQVQLNQRVLLAKQLLSETTLTSSQVAEASGFGSIRRFNEVFQQYCQLSPSRFSARTKGAISSEILTLRLAYRPPLDFAAMLEFFRRRALSGLEMVDDVSYSRVFLTDAGVARLRVSALADRNELCLELVNCPPSALQRVVQRVRLLFDLDADMRVIHACFDADPVLANLVRKRPGLRIPGAWDGFELAVRAILGQQVSVAGATTLTRRLLKQFGTEVVDSRGQIIQLFPTAAQLANAPVQDIGLPLKRAQTIRALAEAVTREQIPLTPGADLSPFIAACCAVRGIGPWTAHYMAMRALAHPDAFPAGDLVLQKTMAACLDTPRLSERVLESRSQQWRPWRAYAVMQLWAASTD